MKQVPGIIRVTVKKAKNILFVISKPDVYKSPGSDTYIIFGEAKIEDLGSASALTKKAEEVLETSENFEEAAATVDKPAEKPQKKEKTAGKEAKAVSFNEPEKEKKEPAPSVKEEKEEVADETGIEPKDIDLVMDQANVSRARAVKALRASNGDIVNAIMNLTGI